jgi:adenylate kinase
LIVLGRQGAGKGTQCTRLSRHYVVPHISTGDMLRNAVKEETELGRKAAEIMDDGGLVPDDVMIGIVEERLARPDAITRGFILDGFPRTVGQAEALRLALTERPIDLVLDLEVPRDLVVQRLAARRVCQDCGTNYSVTGRELRFLWICDSCGGDIVHRADDTEDAINHRLDLYESQTSPLIDYYSQRGELLVVDGVGSPDEVTTRLVAAVDGRQRAARA